MNTHDEIELPPLPEPLCNLPTYCQDAIRQYTRSVLDEQDAAIEADRQARGNVASAISGEPVESETLKICAIADSNYAAGMLIGWNLCVCDDEESFTRIRGDRLRAAAQASRDAKAQDAAPQPQQQVGELANTRVIGEIKLDAKQHPYAILLTGYDENGNQWKEGTLIYAAPQPQQIPEGYRAAPELLEALQAMLEVHGVTQAYAEKHIEIPQLWVEVSDLARAAIAKATGQS